MNLASWSSTGGWKENAAVYKSPEGCSNSKKLFGESWFSLAKAFHFPSVHCPLVEVVYFKYRCLVKLFLILNEISKRKKIKYK